jgi:hypothetical protein
MVMLNKCDQLVPTGWAIVQFPAQAGDKYWSPSFLAWLPVTVNHEPILTPDITCAQCQGLGSSVQGKICECTRPILIRKNDD